MAKSLRSKSKRSFRAKKRESGKYAAAEAARLDRLHAKLVAVKDSARPIELAQSDGDNNGGGHGDNDAAENCHIVEEAQAQGAVSDTVQDGGMALDGPDRSDGKPTSVSTHGPRGSRREEWRKSKGMEPVPKRRGTNRQGALAARRKAGRPSRRR